jgi:phosphoribosylaminoimidazole-succinocarboxamide synthase
VTLTTVAQTQLEGLTLLHRGKVRDCYDLGEHLLIVATDRISAFDCVLSPPIPGKGQVLTSLSVWWFEQLGAHMPHHLVTADVAKMPAAVKRHADVLRGRSMLVKRLKMLPIECVARGYLTGSGWKDYKSTGAVCGHRLAAGLVESVKLSPPIFTPATKEQTGHDINIDFDQAARIVGAELAAKARDATLMLYEKARDIAAARGILIADTKLELGLDAHGTLTLGDEVFTPDSSRFWDAKSYVPGKPQASFDKQQVRDWLDRQGWDHTPPAPPLPESVVAGVASTYREIHRRLTGRFPA